jgi:hypothetical protein
MTHLDPVISETYEVSNCRLEAGPGCDVCIVECTMLASYHGDSYHLD